MGTYFIAIKLQSETTFGRGDGLAGLVDQEVVHDQAGFPYLRGRTLKGALSEECDAIVAVLSRTERWNGALQRLFGRAGSLTGDQASWRYGDALLPGELRDAVTNQQARMTNASLGPVDVLDSLTTLRAQTAIQAASGTPDEGSLRVSRVIIRDLEFRSRLATPDDHEDDLMLLAAGCAALRHLGAGRNRGRGFVRCTLLDASQNDVTGTWLDAFEGAVI